jgi:hypothetical protein
MLRRAREPVNERQRFQFTVLTEGGCEGEYVACNSWSLPV